MQADPTPLLDAVQAVPKRLWQAQRRVEWRHYRAMLDQGIPSRDLVRNGLTFGVVTIQGREMAVTENHRLRAYLNGPGLFKMPGSE